MDFFEIPAAIVGMLAIAGSAAAVSVWYKRNQGKDALDLAIRVNELQKEENVLLMRKNTALQAQLDVKDDLIERLTRNGKKNNS